MAGTFEGLRSSGDDEHAMPTLATVAGMAILIYYADHDPPHFHIRAANFRAKVALSDLSVIEVVGRMRPAEINQIRVWARQHRAALMENWQRAQRLEPLKKIED
jgi:hypothetical protein